MIDISGVHVAQCQGSPNAVGLDGWSKPGVTESRT